LIKLRRVSPNFTPTTTFSTVTTAKSQPQPKDVSPDNELLSPSGEINLPLINHLERTSLVDFDNREAFDRLQEAVTFANTLFEVDTTGVEPMTSVLENEILYLRDDVTAITDREAILSNAVKTEEDYFIAPPGNIPLDSTSKITK